MAHGFHDGDGLFGSVGGLGKFAHQAVGVEVVDVGGCFEVGWFVGFFFGSRGDVEDTVEGFGVAGLEGFGRRRYYGFFFRGARFAGG